MNRLLSSIRFALDVAVYLAVLPVYLLVLGICMALTPEPEDD